MNGHPPVDFPLLPLSYLCAQVSPGSEVGGLLGGHSGKTVCFLLAGGLGDWAGIVVGTTKTGGMFGVSCQAMLYNDVFPLAACCN